MSSPLSFDPAEIAGRVRELARFGAFGSTGVCRTVYSPEWVAAQGLLEEWFRAEGLAVRRDAAGNLWGRLEGTTAGPAIATGSHLDSQRTGGQYDGALGIIAALLAVSALRRAYGPPKRPIEVVAFCEEESSRFAGTAFWGSRAVTGQIQPEDLTTVRDSAGVAIGDAMRAVGLDPERFREAERRDFAAFLELHVEQGPFLEEAGAPAGIVTAITGLRHTRVTLSGRADHAGAMPMDLRRDAMAGAAEIATGVIGNALGMGRPAVTTVGWIALEPGGPAIVPGRATFTVDARHPVPGQRLALYEQHEALIREVAARRQLGLEMRVTMDIAPAPMDPALVALLEARAKDLALPYLLLASGAGHDTQRMATICPAAMVFVRSKDGRSHTPEEYTAPEDAAAGIRLLSWALRDLAY